jgi:hypothetical protein
MSNSVQDNYFAVSVDERAHRSLIAHIQKRLRPAITYAGTALFGQPLIYSHRMAGFVSWVQIARKNRQQSSKSLS